MRGQRLSRDGNGRDNNPLHTKPTCTRGLEVVRRMIVASSGLYHPTLDNFELQSVRLGELISLFRLQFAQYHLVRNEHYNDGEAVAFFPLDNITEQTCNLNAQCVNLMANSMTVSSRFLFSVFSTPKENAQNPNALTLAQSARHK